MKRVLFVTNASCPEGLFGEGATADLSDAQALEFERQGAVKILETASQTLTAAPESTPEAAVPAENATPTPDVAQAGTQTPAAAAEQTAPQVVQVSASDAAGVETKL